MPAPLTNHPDIIHRWTEWNRYCACFCFGRKAASGRLTAPEQVRL